MAFVGKASKIASLVLLLVGVGSMLTGVVLLIQQALLTGMLLFMVGLFMLVLLVRLAHIIAQQQVAQQAAQQSSQQSAQMGQPQQGQIVVVAYPPKQDDSHGLIGKCPRCGAPVREVSNFCPTCGANLKELTQRYGGKRP